MAIFNLPMPSTVTICLTAIIGLLSLLLALWFIILKPKSANYLKLDASSHVVITGGSSGIGLEIAKNISATGARVTILARNVRKLNAAKKEITGSSNCGPVSVVSLDLAVSDEKSYKTVEDAATKIVSDYGAPDILFNCAGTSLAKPISESDFSLYPWLASVNYFGTVAATKAFLPHMKSNGGGRILITSSGAGQIGLFGYTAYSASKFALRGFAESLAMEHNEQDNVFISVAYPPNTDTPGFEEENKEKPKETRLMEDEAGLYQADVVAKGMVEGAKEGRYSIYWGVEGWMLATVTGGMGPCDSTADFLSQVCLTSLLRFIGMFYLMDFRRIVKRVRRDGK
ncbi:hypothetical protein TrCOL_g4508 [Triparma columacea]|uniref:3-dehydrosphinganine reductase n=1 Tax=Triparma columacea TaxID=722753 RepID=A0A9W7L1Y6_9STRA|nr:hypothetical protein TrCOL_g4508 [Triparma columacea]